MNSQFARRKSSWIPRAIGLGAVCLCAIVGCAFEGPGTGAGNPPDVHVAAGPNHVVEITNSFFTAFDKQGEPIVSISANSLFGNCATGIQDPRIRYDPSSSRWYAASMQRTPPKVCFAVSAGDDPTSTFMLYDFPVTPGLWVDFPQLGFSADKVAVSGYLFQQNPGQGPPPGYAIWVIDKTGLVNGTGATLQYVFLGQTNLFAPATTLDTTTLELFMAGFGSSSLTVWTVSGVPGVGQGVQTSAQDIPFVSDFSSHPPTQKGTLDLLDVDPGVRDVVYRSGILWMAGTNGCLPAGDSVSRSCLRVVQLSRSGSLFSIQQDIQYGMSGQHFFFPALTLDSAGTLIVGFGASGADRYPSFMATGRRVSDPWATLRSPVLLAAGQAPFGNANGLAEEFRYGDYFGAATDPTEPETSWLAGQYATYPALRYGTRIQQVTSNVFD